jgi:hypothetical protein
VRGWWRGVKMGKKTGAASGKCASEAICFRLVAGRKWQVEALLVTCGGAFGRFNRWVRTSGSRCLIGKCGCKWSLCCKVQQNEQSR